MPDAQIELIQTTAQKLSGKTLAQADVRAKTGCTILGIARAGEIRTDITPQMRLETDDEFIVCGTDDAVAEFLQKFKA